MPFKHTLIIALFLVAVVAYVWRAFHFEATQSGELFHITQGFTKSVLKVEPSQEKTVYLLMGEGLRGRKHYQAILPVIPLGQLQELNELYGDFRKCKSPGAGQAKKNVVYLKITVGNETNLKKLREVLEISKKHQVDDLIVLTTQPYSVIEQSSFSRRNRAVEALPGPEVFAASIELEKMASY